MSDVTVRAERATRRGILNSRVPEGPIENLWDNYQASMKLVAPANRGGVTDLDIAVP